MKIIAKELVKTSSLFFGAFNTLLVDKISSINGDSTQDITESLFGSLFAFNGLWISQHAPEIHAQILN